jgi:thiamine-monophosphate kinase
MAGEFEHIAWLRQRIPARPEVVIGPGDDCAVVKCQSELQLITTDMLMDGVDFEVGKVEPRRIGRKALAVNLSDIAAMAGVPRTAVVSVASPKGSETQKLAEELFFGMKELADQFDVAIVGGDTNSWTGPLVISITVHGDVTERGCVTRAGAQSGDWLFVTGPLGNSIAGHHLDFTPRVREALELNEFVKLNAMIDISDGLTADLKHILDESHCGAVLVAESIPKNGTLAQALGDGEDFELLFAVSPDDGAKLQSRKDVWKIGECVESGMWIVETGVRRELKPMGWEHHFDRGGAQSCPTA